MARTFNGTSDQIAFGSEAAIDDLGPFTACAWVRITGNVTDERQILTKMNSSFNGKMFIAASGGGGSNNKVVMVVSGSASVYSETVADILAVNTWKVIVTTWDGVGVSGLGKVYACTLGGAMAEASYVSQTGLSGLVTDAAATLRIGARDPADATFFAGGIAECALWNRVLSAGELAALGRGFAPAFFPNGRVFYSKVDGRSSPELNYAGTTHGTLTGTTYLEHPPIIYPIRSTIGRHIASVGGSFQAAWARNANTVLGVGAR